MQVEAYKHNELDNMKFYNVLIKALMTGMNRLIRLPDKGHLWPIVDATNLVLVAGEAAMSQAATTRTYCYFCVRTPDTYIW